jgi:hypothetical protein
MDLCQHLCRSNFNIQLRMARNYCVRSGGGKKCETCGHHTLFYVIPRLTTHMHNGIWSVLKFVYVHMHFGVEDGTVLFRVQIRICTYTHPVNT